MHLNFFYKDSLRPLRNIQKWNSRLTLHEQLTKCLKVLIGKNKGRLEKLKEEWANGGTEKLLQGGTEDKIIDELIASSSSQALEDMDKLGDNIIKVKRENMLLALNKMFLGDAGMTVRQLIDSCRVGPSPKANPDTASANSVSDPNDMNKKKSTRVNAKLRSKLLHKNSIITGFIGRRRKLLPTANGKRFGEPHKSANLLLIECLSPGLHSTYWRLQCQVLNLMEAKLTLQPYQEDVQYKKWMQYLSSRLDLLNKSMQLSNIKSKRKKELLSSSLNKKIKTVNKLFQNYYNKRKKKIQSQIDKLNDIAVYLENHMEKIEELPMNCLSKDSRPLPQHAVDLLASDLTPDIFAKLSIGSNTSSVVEDEMEDDGNKRKRNDKNLRMSSLRKRKQTSAVSSHNEQSQNSSSCKPAKKISNLDQLAMEKERIPKEPAQLLTNLPYLPPTIHTLNTLKALLLQRQELIKRAGDLYVAENYRHEISAYMQTGNMANSGDSEVTTGDKNHLLAEKLAAMLGNSMDSTGICEDEHRAEIDILTSQSGLRNETEQEKMMRIESRLIKDEPEVLDSNDSTCIGAASNTDQTPIKREPYEGRGEGECEKESEKSQTKTKKSNKNMSSSYEITYDLAPSSLLLNASKKHKRKDENLTEAVLALPAPRVICLSEDKGIAPVTSKGFASTPSTQKRLVDNAKENSCISVKDVIPIEITSAFEMLENENKCDGVQSLETSSSQQMTVNGQGSKKTSLPKGNMVVIRVEPNTNNISHPSTSSLTITQSTSTPTPAVSAPPKASLPQPPEPYFPNIELNSSIIHALRETPQYKALAARYVLPCNPINR